MQELFGRIHEIKRKAGESETMVQEICSDIKSLDYAKKYSFPPSRLSLDWSTASTDRLTMTMMNARS